jgi:hypothetical protein
MAGIRDLMNQVYDDPYFSAVLNTDKHPEVPAIPYDNRTLAEILRSDPKFSGTNVGANAGAYLDPRYETGLTPFAIGQGREGNIVGGYYKKYLPERNDMDRVWASVGNTPRDFVDTLAHENIHANTFEGPAREEAAKHRFLGHSPYLRYELMEMEHEKLPTPLTKEERAAAWDRDSPGEPAAWIGAREAMLPSGQMPIQEEMNRRGLGALYAHMTTAGPVATRLPPSILQRLQDYMSGEPSEEPYELRGNEVEKARKSK